GSASLGTSRGRLEFDHVSFCYPGTSSGVRDVSFCIEPGEFVGIVGPSGGGKSTIIDLCMRFYEPERGHILLDGQDIAAVPAHELRSAVGLVAQDLALWNAPVKENLLYALRRTMPWDEVVEVCRKVRVDDFVHRLPKGYDTVVGPRGVKLSGGERQRIALARVFLNEPVIILFDEATAALDTITEAAVVEAVAVLAATKTRIVVAHRLATVVAADRILVIDNGEVVEAGKPSDLLLRGGLYARLYATQELAR
ncbi:MAG: ATP-binding cassette domain-containing protein, partial [Chloroflexi bacterium]|nr:ATP-binding cassette domain-containing protein [Chloroflexota bacterium]